MIYSFNRIKNDKLSLQKENFRDLVEMQALDDHTIAFITEAPNAVFLDRLQNRYIIGKNGDRSAGRRTRASKNPSARDPYRFVSWQRDGNLVLTRHDHYWRQQSRRSRKSSCEESKRMPAGSRDYWRDKAM